jgi:hypothetical protein
LSDDVDDSEGSSENGSSEGGDDIESPNGDHDHDHEPGRARMEWGPLVSSSVDLNEESRPDSKGGEDGDGELSMLEKIFVFSKSEFRDHR